MKPTSKTWILAAVLAAFTLAAPAVPVAQARPQNLLWSGRNDGWSAIQMSQGCYLIFYRDGLVKGWGGYDSPELTVSASGQCGADGLAEGAVTVEFIWPMQTYRVIKQLAGTAHEGVLQGQAQETIGDNENDSGFHLRDLGDARNPSPSFYRDGCEFSDNADGQFVYPMDEGCSAAGIQPMIDQLRQAGLIGGGQATAPQPAPAQASGGAAGGDVFGRCVSLAAEEKRGIQDYWSLTNRCDQTVIARYCFKANYEAAGNEALCSQGQYRTTEIKAGAKVDFTFSLTEEGTPMSNGVIAGPNALSVYGFACTGGAFPQVSFEDRKLKFLGCS